MKDDEPLRGNPKRQAVPALRGFAHQAWQSALTWVTMGESETLFLEGAEDLDVAFGKDAVTVQIKASKRSRSLTLNSSEVTEAIAHFWEHRANNPERRISFHFISTSKRSREKGNPFGDDAGLDVWDRSRPAGVDLSKVRAFLSSHPRLPEDLREFISTASEEDVRNELIARIRWDTESEPREEVQELIKERLIERGQRWELLPEESIAVLPHLYFRIWEVLLRSDNRVLRSSDFAILFQDVTTDRESKSELRRLRSRDRELSKFLSEAGPLAPASRAVAIGTVSTSTELIGLPVFDRLAKRTQLLTELRCRLATRGIMVLQGSTGMAKSTLASQLIADERPDWRHFDFRGVPPDVIRQRLLDAALASFDEAVPASCLIDDLNFDEKPDLYVSSLIGLIRVVFSRGGNIILTTQNDVPTKLRLTFELTGDCVLNVPVLTLDEIKEVAKNYGCPEGLKLAAWSGAILANTSGHPLLVHAQTINVAASNWPKPKMEDYVKSSVIEDVRREIRKKLQEQIPEEARTLAYRLSILASNFRRSHALHMARFPPAVKNPGEAFDLLLGPWIERLDSDYHRLSDLLRGSANEVFSSSEIKPLNAMAAAAFCTQQPIGPSELRGILLHGLAGEHDKALFGAYNASNRIAAEHWPAISEEIFIFSYLHVADNQELYPQNHFLNLLLRHLQLRIAVEATPPQIAIQIAEQWSAEIEQLDDRRVPGSRLMVQFTLLSEILKRPSKVTFPIRLIVTNLIRAVALLQDARSQAPKKKILRQMFKLTGDWTDYREYVFFAALRCRSVSDLAEFLATLKDSKTREAQLVWDELKENNQLAMQLVDGAWLDESKAPNPDWRKCIDVFEAASECGRTYGADSLIVAAGRAKAIVLKEYLDDTEGALRALDQAKAGLGHKHLVLKDYGAKILSLSGSNEDALEIWTSLVPALEADGNPGRAFSYQSAAICASNLGKWSSAVDFFKRAEDAVRQAKWTGEIAAAFKADRAFTEWIEGNRAEAVLLFFEVIDEIDSLADRATNPNLTQFRGKIGAALKWMLASLKDVDDLNTPPYGFFSDSDRRIELDSADTEKIAEPVYLWYPLAELELICSTRDLAFLRFDEAASRSEAPHVRSSLTRFRIKRSLRKLSVEGLVDDCVAFNNDLSDYAQAHGHSGPQTTGSQLLLPLLFVALLRLVSEGKTKMIPLSKWSEDSQRCGLLDERLSQWFDCTAKLIDADEFDLLRAMKNKEASIYCRSTAALLVSADETIDPHNRFYANIGFVWFPDLYGLWREDVEKDIASFVTNGWSSAIVNYRFALRSPNVTAPAIASACSDKAKGFKKAARVILAAHMAVSQRVDATIISSLRKLAS